jgi:hypothetical protein
LGRGAGACGAGGGADSYGCCGVMLPLGGSTTLLAINESSSLPPAAVSDFCFAQPNSGTVIHRARQRCSKR